MDDQCWVSEQWKEMSLEPSAAGAEAASWQAEGQEVKEEMPSLPWLESLQNLEAAWQSQLWMSMISSC